MKGIIAKAICTSLIGACALNVSVVNATPITKAVKWQTVFWQHMPLNITLPVGTQRVIRVPHSAEIGLPANITADVTTQRYDGWFYLTAKRAFNPVTAEIRDNLTGQTIIINLSAKQGASDYAIDIRYPKGKAENNQTASNPNVNSEPVALQGSMAFKTLTQYAEQQLYAPKRLLKNPDGISLVQSFVNQYGRVPQHKWVYNLFVDGSVVAMPWASWYGGNYYVTAIKIKNLLNIKLNLVHNILNLCGRLNGTWKAVDFFQYKHQGAWMLKPNGQFGDTTMGFFISAVPFTQAMAQCRAGA